MTSPISAFVTRSIPEDTDHVMCPDSETVSGDAHSPFLAAFAASHHASYDSYPYTAVPSS